MAKRWGKRNGSDSGGVGRSQKANGDQRQTLQQSKSSDSQNPAHGSVAASKEAFPALLGNRPVRDGARSTTNNSVGLGPIETHGRPQGVWGAGGLSLAQKMSADRKPVSESHNSTALAKQARSSSAAEEQNLKPLGHVLRPKLQTPELAPNMTESQLSPACTAAATTGPLTSSAANAGTGVVRPLNSSAAYAGTGVVSSSEPRPPNVNFTRHPEISRNTQASARSSTALAEQQLPDTTKELPKSAYGKQCSVSAIQFGALGAMSDSSEESGPRDQHSSGDRSPTASVDTQPWIEPVRPSVRVKQENGLVKTCSTAASVPNAPAVADDCSVRAEAGTSCSASVVSEASISTSETSAGCHPSSASGFSAGMSFAEKVKQARAAPALPLVVNGPQPVHSNPPRQGPQSRQGAQMRRGQPGRQGHPSRQVPARQYPAAQLPLGRDPVTTDKGLSASGRSQGPTMRQRQSVPSQRYNQPHTTPNGQLGEPAAKTVDSARPQPASQTTTGTNMAFAPSLAPISTGRSYLDLARSSRTSSEHSMSHPGTPSSTSSTASVRSQGATTLSRERFSKSTSSSSLSSASTSDVSVDEHRVTTAMQRLCSSDPADWVSPGGHPELQPKGFVNPGNNCFANVVVQALLGTAQYRLLLQCLVEAAPRLDEKETPLLKLLAKLGGEMMATSGGKCGVDPGVWADVGKGKKNRKSPSPPGSIKGGCPVGKPLGAALLTQLILEFKPDIAPPGSSRQNHLEQEDAQEFYQYLVERTHEELLKLKRAAGYSIGDQDDAGSEEWLQQSKRGKTSVTRGHQDTGGRSIVTSLFRGSLKSTVKARHAAPSVTIQSFNQLHLDITDDKVNTVEDAVRLMVTPETVQGYRAGGKGQEVEALKEVKLHHLPQTLVLHLKRFTYGATGNVKVHKHVAFNTSLRLLPSVLSEDCLDRKAGGVMYQLVATVNHHGKGAAGGHYTADVRQMDGSWLRFNDAVVDAVSTHTVTGERPYMLMYEKLV